MCGQRPSRVRGAGEGWQRRRGAEAADLGEVAFDEALVAGEAHDHMLARLAHVECLAYSAGPRHLALLAVDELVAVGKGLALPRVEHLLAHLVAAWDT